MGLFFIDKNGEGKCSSRECKNTRKKIEKEENLKEIEMVLDRCNKCALGIVDESNEAYHTRNAIGGKYAQEYMAQVYRKK